MATRRRPASERRPSSGAVSSMRWLVVGFSPPESSSSRPSSMRMAPQPPGPGLPEQAPSVYMTIGDRSAISVAPHPGPLPRGERESREGISGGPVEVAAAGLAGDQRGLRAQLLQALGRDRHAAGPAEVRLGHRYERQPAPGAQDPVVVGQDGAGELAGQLLALGADPGQLGLDRAELLLGGGLLTAALGLALLEARLRLADVAGEPFLGLHEDQNLFLHLGLFLLDVLDLDQDRGVFLVGLDLVQAGFVLAALGLDDLQVLFLRALVLAGGVEPGLGLLDLRPGVIETGVDGGDLPGEPRGVRLEGGDARVDRLQIDQCLELLVHYLPTRVRYG